MFALGVTCMEAHSFPDYDLVSPSIHYKIVVLFLKISKPITGMFVLV